MRYLLKGLFISLIALNFGTPAYADIGVIADLEGDWAKIEAFAQNSQEILTITQGEDGEPVGTLHEAHKIVFLGDAIDKGPNNHKILRFLLNLKARYRDRVIFILGNRDINKLRFNWEFKKCALNLNEDVLGDYVYSLDRFRVTDWRNDFSTKWLPSPEGQAYAHGAKKNDQVLKLKFLLSYTLGSPGAFEFVRTELKTKKGPSVTDQQVYDYFRSLVSGNGLLASYLREGQLLYFDQESGALFAHGGVNGDNYGYVPETAYGLKNERRVPGLTEWVSRLNKWAQDCIEAGIAGDMINALPLIEYQEPLVQQTKTAPKRLTWDAPNPLPNPISVIHGRPWSPLYNLAQVDAPTIARLMAAGVNKLVFGHSPVGQIAIPLKDGHGFTSVACDTSVTSPPRVSTIVVSEAGVKIWATYYNADPAETVHLRYDSQDPATGIWVKEGDISYVQIRDLDGKGMLGVTFKKAAFGPFGLPTYLWQPTAPEPEAI